MQHCLAVLTALPSRFWVYSYVLTFVAGLMTGAARLPWWAGACAGAASGVAVLLVVLIAALLTGAG